MSKNLTMEAVESKDLVAVDGGWCFPPVHVTKVKVDLSNASFQQNNSDFAKGIQAGQISGGTFNF
jgi:hypothetical protein